jgi:hypothetical protein
MESNALDPARPGGQRTSGASSGLLRFRSHQCACLIDQHDPDSISNWIKDQTRCVRINSDLSPEMMSEFGDRGERNFSNFGSSDGKFFQLGDNKFVKALVAAAHRNMHLPNAVRR